MSEQRPKFPESLPPPIEFTEGPRHVDLTEAELSTEEDIQGLVSDLYWHSDDCYFLFFSHGRGVVPDLTQRLESQGVALRKTELYFYRHPHSAYENHFIRVLPHAEAYEWQQEAARGQMYGRVTLTLEPWRRKQLDIAQIATATIDEIARNEPVVEVKPNIWGIGLNFHGLLRKIKMWWRMRRRSN